MEFKIKREDFLGALYWAQSTVERRNTMPILAHVLIESKESHVMVTATDLEVGVRTKLEGDVAQEGVMTVSAKKLYEIVREISEEEVQLRRLDNDWVEIKSGRSVFRMVGLDAREFPEFPVFPMEKLLPVPAPTLKEMIDKTVFSVSTDETRASINGAFLEEGEDGKLRLVATDGHRLALIERAIGPVGLAKGVILPRKGLGELRKLLEEAEEGIVSLGFRENMGLAVSGNVELFMRLIESDFPDYSKVIPEASPNGAKVKQRAFLRALRRVSILSSERYKGVKLEFKHGSMAVSTSNPDLGEATEEVEAEYEGKAMTVGFNARYLMDVLGVLEDAEDICFELKDELSPGRVKKEADEGYLYVVMPMRL